MTESTDNFQSSLISTSTQFLSLVWKHLGPHRPISLLHMTALLEDDQSVGISPARPLQSSPVCGGAGGPDWPWPGTRARRRGTGTFQRQRPRVSRRGEAGGARSQHLPASRAALQLPAGMPSVGQPPDWAQGEMMRSTCGVS